jgi:hypothetical protein
MPSPPLRVFLTKTQDRKLLGLINCATVSQKVKERSTIIRLSAIGWKVEKIAANPYAVQIHMY